MLVGSMFLQPVHEENGKISPTLLEGYRDQYNVEGKRECRYVRRALGGGEKRGLADLALNVHGLLVLEGGNTGVSKEACLHCQGNEKAQYNDIQL